MLKCIKKNAIVVFLTLVFCFLIGLPAVGAGGKPSVELMDFRMTRNDAYGWVSAEFYCRNNSNKVIKYIEWDISARNRVGDRIGDAITGVSVAKLQTIGPMEPFTPNATPNGQKYTAFNAQGTPFSEYSYSGYWMNHGVDRLNVYLDRYNNFFVVPYGNDIRDAVYLTDDEILNAMYTDYVVFDNIFYNSLIDHLQIERAVVTYMDNTTEVISGADVVSDRRYAGLQNAPFLSTVQQYSTVYNYEDYKALNQDLIATLGDNPKRLLEHFINNGMKEGRQGSYEFNLEAYKANNPDLVAAFGNDNVKYYEHYISSGKAEGRKAV